MANPYLPSGTVFPFQNPSTVLPGDFLYGQDSVAQLVSTTGVGTPLTGAIGAWSMPVQTGRILHALAVTGVTYTIGALDQGLNASSTPGDFKILDLGGSMASQNVKVSGAAGVLINGSTAAITLNTNYGVKSFTQTTGNAWIAY